MSSVVSMAIDDDVIVESGSSGPGTPIGISNPETPRSLLDPSETRNTPPLLHPAASLYQYNPNNVHKNSTNTLPVSLNNNINNFNASNVAVAASTFNSNNTIAAASNSVNNKNNNINNNNNSNNSGSRAGECSSNFISGINSSQGIHHPNNNTLSNNFISLGGVSGISSNSVLATPGSGNSLGQTVGNSLGQTVGNSLGLNIGNSSLGSGTSSSYFPVSQNLASQSKYAQLLAVIEEMGKDIRPTYSGNKNSAERLKRGIMHARILVRECLLECEKASRS